MTNADAQSVIALAAKSYQDYGVRFAGGTEYGCLLMQGPGGSMDKLNEFREFGTRPSDQKIEFRVRVKVSTIVRLPHVRSSFQLRNPIHDVWGGAIRIPKKKSPIAVMAWAGFADDWHDEAFMLQIAHRAGLMSIAEADAIARLSGNPYFNRVFDLVH